MGRRFRCGESTSGGICDVEMTFDDVRCSVRIKEAELMTGKDPDPQKDRKISRQYL